MAGEKTTKRKQRGGGGSGDGGSQLRLRTDPRSERRFEPKASGMAIASMVGLSLGSLSLGAGVYGQWLRAEELGPHAAAPYLLIGGALALLGLGLFGQRAAKPIRVGDAGIAIEKEPGELERLEWRDVSRIVLGSDMLTLVGDGTSISVPMKEHGQAAARALAEARARIPKMLEEVDTAGVPSLEDDAGEVLPLDKPQLAGVHCKATDKLIAFDRDARLCGKCGEVYHKDHVPGRCLTCDARLG